MHQRKSFYCRHHGEIKLEKCPYVANRVGGHKRRHRPWGIIGRLGSWLGLDGVGRTGPQIKLRRLALDGDGERDGPQLALIGDVGIRAA